MLVRNKTSEAYDFELFETRDTKKKENEKPEIEIKKGSRAKNGNIIKILLAAVCAVSIPIYFLSSKVTLSELTVKINNELIELEKAQSENLRLQSELDNLITLAKVEEYAKNELGMQKITMAQCKYVSLDTGGMTEIAEDDTNAATFLADWFSDVLEYLGFK